jgi:hypothetical protein
LSPFFPILAASLLPDLEDRFSAGPGGFQILGTEGSRFRDKQDKFGQGAIEVPAQTLSLLRGVTDPVFGGLRPFEQLAVTGLPNVGAQQGLEAIQNLNSLTPTAQALQQAASDFATTGFPADIGNLIAATQELTAPVKADFSRSFERDILPTIQEALGNPFDTDISLQAGEAGATGLSQIAALETELGSAAADRSLQSLGLSGDLLSDLAGLFQTQAGAPFQLIDALIGAAQSGRQLAFSATPEGQFLNAMLLLAGLPSPLAVQSKGSAASGGGQGGGQLGFRPSGGGTGDTTTAAPTGGGGTVF